MNRVFIALGSNKGETGNNLHSALDSIKSECEILRVSTFYRTRAQNMADGHDQEFLNAVCEIKTDKNPDEFLNFLLDIESKAGRKREASNSSGYLARELDLDILLFNDEMISKEHLIIPHPQLTNRFFVIEPLFEIAPDLMIPGIQKTVRFFYESIRSKNNCMNDGIAV